MNKFVSIKTKLIINTMLLLLVTFAILLSVISVANIITVNKNVEKSQKSIRNALGAKGKTLAKNNSMAMSGMAEDNAFTAIQNLVASTVSDDEDLVYGIYMDNTRTPWVFAHANNPSGVPKESKPLDDSASQWASSLKQPGFKEIMSGKSAIDIIEFAAPVKSDEQILGCIRYGLSTKAMTRSMIEAKAAGTVSRRQSIFIILFMGIFSIVLGYFIIQKVAAHITRPIGSLVNSSKIIAEGNYDVTVKPESNDEIGDLAGHFETMRATIKKYTDHLQDLIDEKMQQVNDILNNIDQGLFTINLDGTVNHEYSARANKILKVSDVASCTIKDLLRFDAKQEKAFHTWLDLVQKKHTEQRWVKLAKLAPVQEIELPAQPNGTMMEYIAIAYQRIYDKKANLSKIMVLALDETEKRHKDMQMAAERLRHENDVKAILSIANTPAEELTEFTEDTSSRLYELHSEIKVHLDEVNFQRENHPGSPPYAITKEQIDRLYRNFHTIKGNGGSYGFEMLSHFAHLAEDELEKLREPVTERRGMILSGINELLIKMDQTLDDILAKIKFIFGKDEEITVRIPETRINSIVDMSRRLQPVTTDPKVKMLLAECVMLSWKPLRTLLRKYQKLALKIARKLHKNINFSITDDNKLYPYDILNDLDEVLIHLLRNCVDHGIEDPENREELGKGIGRIQVSLQCTDSDRTITISDDGRGIETDLLVAKSIEKGVLTKEQAAHLSETDKMMLLFKGGISTSVSISDISGRGIGMQIIYRKITEQLHGTIKIDSVIGKGTAFTITIPNK
jgi:signal transduction histidine kinase/HAMP domain-containing protein